MNKQKQVFMLIKELTGQANILTIPRLFIDYTGDVNTALLLSQVIYWSDKNPTSQWFYKSYEDWQRELGLTEYQTRRSINILKRIGIIETQVRKANGNPTLHYHFIQKAFIDRLLKFLKERNLKNSRNLLTEIKTKTTRRNKKKRHYSPELQADLEARKQNYWKEQEWKMLQNMS